MRLLLPLFAVIILFGYTNCADYKLDLLPEEQVVVASVGELCVAEPENVNRFVKFLFVVDKSGSNANASGGVPATDPGATRRAGSIQDFLDRNRNNAFMQWGMIVFRDTGNNTISYIGAPQAPEFTSDPTVMDGAIERLRTEVDQGGTPYGAALTLAKRAIELDLERFPEEDSTYNVIFLSDGFPTDIASVADAQAATRSVVDVSPGRVYLSTGYYGPGNDNDYLRGMAEVGGGQFLVFNNGGQFDLDRLVVGPSKDPWVIREFMVYNLNSTICEDGKWDTDSDADGVCDRDEVLLNLNPQNRYSNTVTKLSDYFTWRTRRFGETFNPCQDTADDDLDGLLNCEEDLVVNNRPIGTQLRVADMKNPDTDMDGFTDWIELLTFKSSRGVALDNSNMLRVWDSDRMSAGAQVKQHKNPLIGDPDAFSYDTDLQPTGINALGQQCYRFKQTKLLLYPTKAVGQGKTHPKMVHGENENVVQLYFVQVPSAQYNSHPGIYRHSFQRLLRDPLKINTMGAAAGLRVNEGVFSTYVIPKN